MGSGSGTEMRLEKPARARARLQRAFVTVNGTDIGVRMLSVGHKELQGSHFPHGILEPLLSLPGVCRASLEAWRPNFMDGFRGKPRELTKGSR